MLVEIFHWSVLEEVVLAVSRLSSDSPLGPSGGSSSCIDGCSPHGTDYFTITTLGRSYSIKRQSKVTPSSPPYHSIYRTTG